MEFNQEAYWRDLNAEFNAGIQRAIDAGYKALVEKGVKDDIAKKLAEMYVSYHLNNMAYANWLGPASPTVT